MNSSYLLLLNLFTSRINGLISVHGYSSFGSRPQFMTNLPSAMTVGVVAAQQFPEDHESLLILY